MLKATRNHGAFGNAIIEGRLTEKQCMLFFHAVRTSLSDGSPEVAVPSDWSIDTLITLTDLYNSQAMEDGTTLKTPNCFDRKVMFNSTVG